MASIYHSGRGISVAFTEFSVLPKSKESVGLISEFWRRKLWQVKEMFGATGHAGDLHNTVIQTQVCKGLHVSNTRKLVAANARLLLLHEAHLPRIQKGAGQEMLL